MNEVRQMVADHPHMNSQERYDIIRALEAGEAHGYGNVIAWLATEWAVKLRDKSGLSEAAAIDAVSHRSPYTLPPRAQKEKP